MKNPSFRNCEIVQQVEYLPGYPDWERNLRNRLGMNEEHILGWAYILHDQDTNEAGKLKAPHIHLVLHLDDAYKPSTIGGYVGVPAEYVEAIKQKTKRGNRLFADIGGALSYLTHRNAPEKYQYSDEQVQAKPGYDWMAIRDKSESERKKQKAIEAVLEAIEAGEIKRHELCDYVSSEQYSAFKKALMDAFEYREMKLKQDTSRKMEVVFISGESGSGKTTMAKRLCEKRGLSYLLAGSSRDPLQDYDGHDALILDDLRPDTWRVEDLLKLLDNNSASSAGARYRDKWLSASLLIVTTTLPMDSFFRRLQGGYGEPVVQLERRCKTKIELTKDMLALYTYKSAQQHYQLVTYVKNPVAELYTAADVDTSEAELTELCSLLGVEYKYSKDKEAANG